MKNNESLLHYVWKNRLYESSELITSEGEPIRIIDPGMYNMNAGPDFFNAKIKIGNEIWAGNIEIHSNSSDWLKHRHHLNKAYNSVILHVVEKIDQIIMRTDGSIIPHLTIKISDSLKENYEYLIKRDTDIPCLERLTEIHPLYITDWISTLLFERLEKKTKAIFYLLNEYKEDWQEVFYIILSRNFGFGINNDAFEQLAKSLPLKVILKHSNSPLQVDALFFGQAGLLNENINDKYYCSLQKEYSFLSKKFNLQSLDECIFKNLRMRPCNFPYIKLAQLSSLIRKQKTLFSKLFETENIQDLRALFISEPEAYWQTHYHFKQKSSSKKKILGRSALNIILINTVVPFLFAYGNRKGIQLLIEKAVKLLQEIPSENNAIITAFSRAGIQIQNASDSQAIIQLKREYCEKKKCMYCRIGHKLLLK